GQGKLVILDGDPGVGKSLMVRHFNKQNDWRARYRCGGSIGLGGSCRCTWMVERDPDLPGQCVLAQVKNNSLPLHGSLDYTVSTASAPADDLSAAPVALTWTGPSPWSADQLLAATLRKRPVL